MSDDITCIILAGGQNNRMGKNKALLKVRTQTIIEIIYEKLHKICGEVIVISNEPDLYRFLNTKTFRDIYPGKGPLSGVHSGLFNSETEKNFIVSCDIPLISTELVKYLIKFNTAKDIVIPKTDQYIQTMCGLYSKNLLPLIEERLVNNNENEIKIKQRRFSLINLAMDSGAEIVDVANLPFYNENIFLNLNTKNDLEIVKRLLEKQDDKKN